MTAQGPDPARPIAEIVAAVTGAWRLARGDRTGVTLIDRSPDGALRSFRAAAVVAPGYLVLLALRLDPGAAAGGIWPLLLVETIAYVISWTAFPVVMIDLARLFDRFERYPDFVAIYNWGAVVQAMVYIPVIVCADLGLVPPPLGGVAVLVVTAVVIGYQWYILRVALDLPPATTAALVVLDLVLAVFIAAAADGLV